MNFDRCMEGGCRSFPVQEDFGEMDPHPSAERRFAHALAVSAAIHAALLMLLLASAAAPEPDPPAGENVIRAFLVQGSLPMAPDRQPLPVRKRRTADRRDPPAASPVRETPENVAPAGADGERRSLPIGIPPPAASPGTRQETGQTAAPMPASPASAASLSSPLPVLGGGALSGTQGTAIASEGREGGKSSGGSGAAPPVLRREGAAETRQVSAGPDLPKEAAAFPRYGDNARPAYPPLARLRGYQGVVILVVEVLADGSVGQVGIRRSAGHEVLDRAALEAVRTWRFEPGRREGRAVTMSVEVPVRFVLSEHPAG